MNSAQTPSMLSSELPRVVMLFPQPGQNISGAEKEAFRPSGVGLRRAIQPIIASLTSLLSLSVYRGYNALIHLWPLLLTQYAARGPPYNYEYVTPYAAHR